MDLLKSEDERDEASSSRCLGPFMQMVISKARIYFNNPSGEKFYEDAGKDVEDFGNLCGSLIHSLRVEILTLPLAGNEKKLLEGLVNLEDFCAERLEIRKTTREKLNDVDVEERNDMIPIPEFFKRLKCIKIGNKNYAPEFLSLSTRILEQCTLLEYANLPYHLPISTQRVGGIVDGINPLHDFYRALGVCARREGFQIFDHGGFYQDDDIMSIEDNRITANPFLPHCLLASKHGVVLMNVHAKWLLPMDVLVELSPDVTRVIVSIINLQPCVFREKMNILQQVTIMKTSQCGVGDNWKNARPEWPMLEKLDININSNKGLRTTVEPDRMICHASEDTNKLFHVFFRDVKRPTLKELRFNFTLERGQVAIPKMSDVVSACPNLRKLILRNWQGTNKSLIKIFSGITGLVEISLEYCKGLGNVAFVGLDTNNPMFLKQTRLKRLNLIGLDKMPKITNLLFTHVIRHLKLSHLIITSESPVTSVTSIGIRSLLDGKFAKSIEKFPFGSWSLADMTSEDFLNLEKEIRDHDFY